MVGGGEAVMAALDLSKLVNERRFWVASFLVAWAAAFQVPSNPIQSHPLAFQLKTKSSTPMEMVCRGTYMMSVQRQDVFKDKFGDLDAPNSSNGLSAGEQKVTADGEFR
jgi:hypothetical protein